MELGHLGHHTGPNTGSYLISSCGHAWKDFDGREKFNQADAANATATMGNTLADQTMAYYVLRADMSDKPTDSNPPYLSVTFFHVKPEGAEDFRSTVKQVNEAFGKTSTPKFPGYWYSLANGGSGPEMVLVQERKSMAEMAGPSPKTLDQMMKEAYGDQGASMMTTIRKAYYNSDSELLQYRSDLSYTAPSK